MHTDTAASRVEQYLTAHRRTLAYGVAALLAVLLYVAWHVVSRVWGIQSANLDACVFGLSAMGSAILALAFYWSAE